MKIALKFGKSYDILFLIISSFIFFLLRLPSLFEPHWYGDEGIYQVIGMALNNGGLLYKDIWDNKPPLIYLLYALFSSDQFTLRLVSLIFGIISIFVFFFLSKKLFHEARGSKIICFLTTSIFALLLGLPILEGNIANAENFMLLPILIAALLVFNFKFQISNFKFFTAGILLGLGFLFKIVAVFDFLAFLIFLLIISLPSGFSVSLQKEKKYFVSFVQKTSPFIIGFSIPTIITIFYFWAKGAFVDFFRASFLSNVGYIGWQNKLIFPQGLLLLKTILLIISITLIASKRKVFPKNTTFVLLWFVFSLFNAFFSGRPYTHYLLVLLPSASLILGSLFWKNTYQNTLIVFSIVTLILVLKNFNLYGKIIAYYQNFSSFIIGTKSVSSYRAFFDKRTPIDYEIATFVKSKISFGDSIFIWGNNAQVYKMVGVLPPGKYIVAYHIVGSNDSLTSLTSTKEAIEKTKPRFIIIMPDQKSVPLHLLNYSQRINIDNVSIYERLF